MSTSRALDLDSKDMRSEGSKKSLSAFRTIGEVASTLGLPPHVLRFWESKFTQIKPHKRRGGHRYYRPADIEILREIKSLLYDRGYTIKGAQKYLKDKKENTTSDEQKDLLVLEKKQNTSGSTSSPSDIERFKSILSELLEIRKVLE